MQLKVDNGLEILNNLRYSLKVMNISNNTLCVATELLDDVEEILRQENRKNNLKVIKKTKI